MASFNPAVDRCLTAFIHIKTTPEWLAYTIPERLEKVRATLPPIIKEFADTVVLKWYDVEFYVAGVTDIVVLDCKDHISYQMIIAKLRETPFWDKWFSVENIFVGEMNANSKNYGFENFGSQ
jgi:hypothetical protein